jgi:hypothetical protein
MNESMRGEGFSLEQYKRQLRTKVLALFVICVLVIIERIFYHLIVKGELKLIAALQLAWGLV